MTLQDSLFVKSFYYALNLHIMLRVLAHMLKATNYAQNYASIIYTSLGFMPSLYMSLLCVQQYKFHVHSW